MGKKPKRQMKPCDKCGRMNAVMGDKYCHNCKLSVLMEMRQSGYLTDTSSPSRKTTHRGLKSRNANLLGGTSELGTDGDNW